MAAIEAERVFQPIEPLARRLVAGVDQPAIGLEQHGRAEIALAVPPIARARCLAAEAQDAFIEPVELGPVLVALAPFLRRFGRDGLEPGLDGGKLRIGHGEVRHEVLDHRQMRQRVDLHRSRDLVHALGAGERVGAVDVHGAGAADALAAGAPQRQRRIDLVLDPQQPVEHHRPAIVEIDLVGVEPRVVVVVRRPAIDAKLAQIAGPLRLRPGPALLDP